MAFLFGSRGRQKQPAEIARSLKDLLGKLGEAGKNGGVGIGKIEEEVGKHMSQMKLIVQGTPEVDCSPDQVHQLVSCIIQEDILYELARSIRSLPFEARKDAQIIFSHILRWRPNGTPPTTEPSAISYLVLQRPEIIVELCRGYEYPQSAMACGTILRQALQYDTVAAVILYDESQPDSTKDQAVQLKEVDVTKPQSGNGVFWKFFGWINKGSFEVSADAFTTFREILTKHKQLVSQYLATNYDLFFKSHYNASLLLSQSYVTKRQSIKLLGELLLDRANYVIMTQYVASGDNLKLTMNLLKDDRKMVQYEAFHVFKVFVANPNKSGEVRRILVKNRGRLLKFLPSFLDGRTDDDQFLDEKSFLVRQIEMLPEEGSEQQQQGSMASGESTGGLRVGA
ncbi:Hym1p [Exophiala xenobiotica]|nr:Hym1p [Exophiala xenobiotica]KAK5254336.1 Hym1p [Exophiala xenobiotica]KAK5352561.1 Hym1p [Exophiala xenobiotica]KAK5375423.1 Hym1p [Exophiala xenobiotica]KAK5391327.1 Hym1p [Exophiala xenobiotica]